MNTSNITNYKPKDFADGKNDYAESRDAFHVNMKI